MSDFLLAFCSWPQSLQAVGIYTFAIISIYCAALQLIRCSKMSGISCHKRFLSNLWWHEITRTDPYSNNPRYIESWHNKYSHALLHKQYFCSGAGANVIMDLNIFLNSNRSCTLSNSVGNIPNNTSFRVLLPLVEGIWEVEEAPGRSHHSTTWNSPEERRHSGHQNSTWRQISVDKTGWKSVIQQKHT